MKPKIKQLATLSLSLGLITLTSACQKSEPTASPKAPNSSAEASGETADTAAPAQKETEATASLKVSLAAIPHNAVIPAENAFCVEDGKGKAGLSANKSPEVSWEGAPEGTQSFVLLAVDPDVPSKADDVNKEGKSVSKDLARADFYHWVLINIPASVNKIEAGAESDKVTPKGKAAGQQSYGTRGLNNYGDWFSGDKDMGGEYFGYDGPCPPWNDELVHHYHFKVFALDVDKLELSGSFKAPEVLKAMEGHILARGESVGLYKLNAQVSYP